MRDASYHIIEVKRDDTIDDAVVKAKIAAAHEMAVAGGVEYWVYPASKIMKSQVLEHAPGAKQQPLARR